MAVNTAPVLNVHQPAQNSNILLNTPFLVTGTASDVNFPEPIAIASVTVQVDGGVPVPARISIDRTNKNRDLVVFDFDASVEVTGGTDPHIVTVTATNDWSQSVSQSINVFVEVPFAADTPAVIMDLLSIAIADPANPGHQISLQPSDLTGLASGLAKALVPLSDALAPGGFMVAGPNLIAGPATADTSSVRMGIWVEDFSFPVIPPDPPAFPLPRLPDKGVNASFATIPFPRVPFPEEITPSFAVSMPIGAVQKMADGIFPSLKTSAVGQGAELNSIVARGSTSNIEVDVNGYLYLPPVSFTLTVKESFGTQQLGGLDPANPSRGVPAVTGSSNDSTLNGFLEVLFAVLVQPLLGVIVEIVASLRLGGKVASQEQSATKSLKAAFQALPSLIPLSIGDLPQGLPNLPDFPRIVVTWLSFGTSPAGIQGTATTSLDGRDSSMVSIEVDPAVYEIRNSAAELGHQVEVACTCVLTNIAPDSDGLSWRVSGAGTSSGSVDTGSDSFTAVLPLPQPPEPGTTYQFTVTVNAVETKTNSTLTITGSGSAGISVMVTKGKGPPQ